MKKNQLIVTFLTFGLLTGCANTNQMFEPSIYGVRESIWDSMTDYEKQDAIAAYQEGQNRAEEETKLREYNKRKRMRAMQAKSLREVRVNELAEQYYYQYRSQGKDNPYLFNNQDFRSLSFEDQNVYRRRISELQEDIYQQKSEHQMQVDKQDSMESLRQEQADRFEDVGVELIENQDSAIIESDYEPNVKPQLEPALEQTQAPAQEPSPTPTTQQPPAEPTTPSLETSKGILEPSNPIVPTWTPTTAQVEQGGNIIMELQSEIGAMPTQAQMQYRISTKMNLSADKTKTVIENLGLN